MWKYLSISMSVRYLAVLFAYVWGSIEIFRQVKQGGQIRGTMNFDKGSLILLYGAITAGYAIGIPFAFSRYGRLEWGSPYLALCGLGVIVAGISLRVMAMRTLQEHFTYRVSIGEQHELIEQGLYRYIRHPAYLGEVLVCPFIAFTVRMNVEEKALLGHFADRYEAYRKHTWRLLPWFY
jgi:protein-S-isoprenylcysteine O-methyltransferase Ste14